MDRIRGAGRGRPRALGGSRALAPSANRTRAVGAERKAAEKRRARAGCRRRRSLAGPRAPGSSSVRELGLGLVTEHATRALGVVHGLEYRAQVRAAPKLPERTAG